MQGSLNSEIQWQVDSTYFDIALHICPIWEDGSCESTLNNASYTTNEIDFFEDKPLSWYRGFNTEDQRIWNAEKGSYIFSKLD